MDTLDHQLVKQLKVGDQRAVARWFGIYQPKMRALVTQKVESAADADEIVQEVFINCLRQLPLFRGESSLWTWMQSILRHEIADYYRRIYAKRVLKLFSSRDVLYLPEINDSRETAQQVREILNRMSDATVELLHRKYIDGKKVAEIAYELGKSRKSVESELYRARAEFRHLWEAEYG